jgi:hypothetical protein
MLCLRYTRVEERYRLMRIVKGGEKENRRYWDRPKRAKPRLTHTVVIPLPVVYHNLLANNKLRHGIPLGARLKSVKFVHYG